MTLAPVTYSPDSDTELVNKLRTLYTRARDHRRQYYTSWERNYKLVMNKQGTALSSNWMPSPKDSEIYPTLAAIVAWMTDQDIVIDTQAATDPNTPYYTFIQKLSQDISAVFKSTWHVEDYDAQIKLGIWDALMFGIGIYKSVWDNSVSDGYGNALLRRVDPWSFYPDPSATSLSDAEYFVESRKVSHDELERRFPDTYHLCLSGTGSDNIDERPDFNSPDSTNTPMGTANLGSLMGGQQRWGKSRHREDRNDGDQSIVLHEFWIQENVTESEPDGDSDDKVKLAEKLIHTEWRCICMAGGYILFNEKASDLWRYGIHPYDRFVLDDLGEFYGIALVDHIAHPQVYINRLLTALQQNAELVGNPIFLEPTNSGLERVGIINRPGQRLPISGAGAMQNKPDWLRPPEMPQFVMELVNFWITRIENTSGLSAIVRGQAPGGRNAANVVSSIQEATFVRVRSAKKNLEKTLEKASTKLVDLMAENYTDARIMVITGSTGEQSALILRQRHFYGPTSDGGSPLKYVINLAAGSDRPTSRRDRIAEEERLFTLGAIDDQALLEAYGYRDIQSVLKRKYEKQAGGVGSSPTTRQRSSRAKS